MSSYIKLRYGSEEYIKQDIVYDKDATLENVSLFFEDEEIDKGLETNNYYPIMWALLHTYTGKNHYVHNLVIDSVNLAILLMIEEQNDFLDYLIDPETKDPVVINYLFDQCDFISEIRLADGTLEIGSGVFSEINLDKLIIPSKLKGIDEDSFKSNRGEIREIQFLNMTKGEVEALLDTLKLDGEEVFPTTIGKLTFKS